MKGLEVVERHRAVVRNGTRREFIDLLRETFVNVNLLGSDDRETLINVAQHDLAIYLIDLMGDNDD